MLKLKSKNKLLISLMEFECAVNNSLSWVNLELCVCTFTSTPSYIKKKYQALVSMNKQDINLR